MDVYFVISLVFVAAAGEVIDVHHVGMIVVQVMEHLLCQGDAEQQAGKDSVPAGVMALHQCLLRQEQLPG